MADEQAPPAGPDLTQGIALSDFTAETLLGHVGDQDVLLVRSGPEISRSMRIAVIIMGRSRRDSWSARASAAPGIMPASICGPGKLRARRRLLRSQSGGGARGQSHLGPAKAGAAEAARRQGTCRSARQDRDRRCGAAGFAAAEMLRRQEFRGTIVLLSDDSAPPVDRPNLSKDYLAGSAPEDWLPLRPDSFYAEAGIDLRLQKQCRLDRYQRA